MSACVVCAARICVECGAVDVELSDWAHVCRPCFENRTSPDLKTCGFCGDRYDNANDEDAIHHQCGYCFDDEESRG